MNTVSYSEARKNFATIMNKTNDDKAPVLITRGSGKPCVLMSFDEYEALEETAYLLRSPANARHLLESIAELDAGRGTMSVLKLRPAGIATKGSGSKK